MSFRKAEENKEWVIGYWYEPQYFNAEVPMQRVALPPRLREGQHETARVAHGQADARTHGRDDTLTQDDRDAFAAVGTQAVDAERRSVPPRRLIAIGIAPRIVREPLDEAL